MQKIGFSEAVEKITARDERYDVEAYAFLRDALDFTIKLRKKSSKDDAQRHVSGQELLEGVRQYAIKEFGPMVMTVFTYWGLRKCEDVGNIVFNLIEEGIFGKSDHDSLADFKEGYDFREAFVEPFLPPGSTKQQGTESNDQPAEKVK